MRNSSKVSSIKEIAKMKDEKVLLSTSWIFVLFNYLYCDVITLMDAKTLNQIMTGTVGGINMTEGFLLGASILMEIPIVMVLLSRMLNYRINRLTNIIGGIIMTVVQLSSLVFGSSPTMYYIFFSITEISCTSFIVWYAWTWSNSQDMVQAA
jgi:hypothetical protein